MSDEKMRAEFEEWYDNHTKNNGGVAYYMGITGKYCFADIQLAWEAWQASRKALCVELPGPVKGERSFPGSLITSAYNGLLSACKEALDKAGVSYK